MLHGVSLGLECFPGSDVRSCRGRVSASCISMELATDKLLPFLEKWQRDGGSEGKALINKGAGEEEKEEEGPAGEWKFKMYTDVLHAINNGEDSQVAGES